MIRGFSASYAGHIVADNLGLSGTPANDRLYPNAKLAQAFDWALDISKHMEALGYDEFWMAEHHFQPEGYECIPTLLMLSLHQATEIRLRLQYKSNVAPPQACRGLRHCRYTNRRKGNLWSRKRIPQQGSRVFWIADA